jgi:hypothetical protein
LVLQANAYHLLESTWNIPLWRLPPLLLPQHENLALVLEASVQAPQDYHEDIVLVYSIQRPLLYPSQIAFHSKTSSHLHPLCLSEITAQISSLLYYCAVTSGDPGRKLELLVREDEARGDGGGEEK